MLPSCVKYAELARADEYLVATRQRAASKRSRLSSISMNSLLPSAVTSTRTTEPMARTS